MFRRAAPLAIALALVGGCVQRASVSPPPSPPAAAEPKGRDAAKLHLRDGRVVVLEDGWRVSGDRVVGTGREYAVERELLRRGPVDLPLVEVVLVETREKTINPAVIPVAVGAAVSLGVTVYCAINTKACWGSCPTFYVPDGRGGWALEAEGFSSGVARAFETDDLDDLPDARPEGGELRVAMRNEALETHLVRGVSLAVVHGPPGSTVVRGFAPGFLAIGAPVPAAACTGPAMDAAACAALADRDGHEVVMESDGKDLAARTSITLRYPPPGRRDVALVLTARNSLMSTFVLYQMIALLGREYGDFLASLDRGDLHEVAALGDFDRVLGGVDVSVRQGNGAFRPAGRLGYIGPIARATRAVSFPVDDPARPVEVELTFSRAHWKIDAARLAPVMQASLYAIEIPAEIEEGGLHWGPYRPAGSTGPEPTQVAAALRGEGERIATLPGDEIFLRFPVPAGPPAGSTGYFLRSRGYYHEWMREEWLRDEDLGRAHVYLDDAVRALRELAPAYRVAEPTMESVFRNSRFGRQGMP